MRSQRGESQMKFGCMPTNIYIAKRWLPEQEIVRTFTLAPLPSHGVFACSSHYCSSLRVTHLQ